MKKLQSKKKADNSKPKFNTWQNCVFMLLLAWQNQKSVLVYAVCSAAVSVFIHLVGLYISPTVLGTVENGDPIERVVFVILIFTAILMAANGINRYIDTNKQYGQIAIRLKIISMIQLKYQTTAYPNTENQDMLKLLETAQRATGGNSDASEAVWNTMIVLLINIAAFIIYLTILSSVNLLLILITLVTAISGFFINNYINKWGFRHRSEEAGYTKRLHYISSVSSNLGTAKDVRLFGMRAWLEEIYESTMRLYHDFIVRGQKKYIWADIVNIIFSFLRNGAAYFYLITLTLNEGLPASQFLLYFAAIGGFTSWITNIFSNFSILRSQSLELSTIREFLIFEEPFLFENGISIEPDNLKEYRIELKKVSFRYPGAQSDTLKNIDLTLEPGEKLAVVGLNGAGKTTLIKLVCGFFDPTEGEVLLNGVNIKKYNRRDYYRHFSAVFQDFSIISTTVGENISQSLSEADENEMIRCSRLAGLDNKINELSSGFDTHITKTIYNDGIEFSGGETQRLMLARALYKNAPVIVLDEPTAALDPIAESDIYQKYNELTGGRTSVYISHRLASTRFCDRIIYIENGIITESGTHDELLQTGGKYAGLFEIQSRYYREGGIENGEK